MFKKIIYFLPIFLFLFFPNTVKAELSRDTIVTFTNPVRGNEGWLLVGQKPLDLPKYQLEESSRSGFPVTWQLRFDAVTDATISAFFEKITKTNSLESLGAFMEITPSLADRAGVTYPNGLNIFSSNRVFLSGYSQSDRIKLIDTYMDNFFNRFGYYPKTVGAWDIDSFSLEYLQSKYSILAAMNCDDQYSTDRYRLWGGYLGSPYFPDKNNSLIPASSKNNRVNLAMVRWAQRDLFNFYGPGGESSFSVQVNDFIGRGQNLKYFTNLLSLYSQHSFNEFTYINIGLENDFPIEWYRQEIKDVYKTIIENEDKYEFRYLSLAEFGDWFKGRYPESSPAYFYRTKDPTDVQNGEVYWYQSPYYRIGLKSSDGKTKIVDFRIYNRNVYEDYHVTPNHQINLYLDIPAAIDSVKFPGSELVLDFDLTGFKTIYDQQWDLWQISLEKDDQSITFYPKSITFKNLSLPSVNYQDIKVTNKNKSTTWNTAPYTPFTDKLHYSWIFWIVLSIVVIKIINKIRDHRLPKLQLPTIIGIICVVLLTLTVIKSGLVYPFGLGFWGPNGHDAVFHISLIEKFAKNPFNLDHPQYSGVKLTNYHFVFDYLSGLAVRILNIPSVTFYFRLVPIILGLVLVSLLNKLMSRWKYSNWEKIISFVFVFLGGSLGFLPKLITGQDIFSGESAFWVNQSASLFLNPPFALSLVFLLLFLLNIGNENKIKPGKYILLIFLGAILCQTKIYAFVLLVTGLFICRKFKLFTGVVILGTLFTIPFSSFSGSPFIFDPLWFSKSLFASYDRFYWPKFVEAWQAYEATGNIIKLLAVNLFATAIFIIGNLGVRIFGLNIVLEKNQKDISAKLISTIVIIGLLIPLFIVQKVNPWNTIQFTYYSIFFLGLISGRAIIRLLSSISSKTVKVIVTICILFFGTATSIGTFKDYFGRQSASTVSFSEIAGLETLRKQPKGIVLTPAFLISGWNVTPKPLYDYVSTAYVSAFSGQPEFLSDTINLDITGFDYKERSRQVQRFYNTLDRVWARRFLQENDIRYIYETPFQSIKINPIDLSLTMIFDSGGIKIYKTK